MSLRIHHLNCGTMCPYCERLVNGRGSWIRPARLVCHCLLLETAESLTLIDTGIGSADVRDPRGLGRRFVRANRPVLSLEETALAQVRALGFDPRDVRHIVTTHLDVDHAGGLADFPEASVHVFAPELQAALNAPPELKVHYRAHHFSHGPRWVSYEEQGDEWFGFSAIRTLEGLGADVLLIPLVGHTLGHTGVAVRDGDRWWLHCGDAYFHHGTLEDPPRVPLALAYFERKLQINGPDRLRNQERLRQLAARHADTVRLFCAHDPYEWDRYATTPS